MLSIHFHNSFYDCLPDRANFFFATFLEFFNAIVLDYIGACGSELYILRLIERVLANIGSIAGRFNSLLKFFEWIYKICHLNRPGILKIFIAFGYTFQACNLNRYCRLPLKIVLAFYWLRAIPVFSHLRSPFDRWLNQFAFGFLFNQIHFGLLGLHVLNFLVC